MNYKVIFNALIIILIVHLLIVNLDFHEMLDFSSTGTVEGYQDNTHDDQDGNMQNLLDQQIGKTSENTTENEETKENFQNELLDYAKSIKFDSSTDILPMNYYESNENTPNFESNVANVSKFYDNNYENLSKDDLKQLDTSNKLVNEVGCVGRQTNSSDDQPDYWKYQNELPMNGGDMGGIVGFDSLDGQYGLYDDNGQATGQACASDGMNLDLQSNDLRKPDVVN
jgi:hypothetical protein